jgi:hypothetical protein
MAELVQQSAYTVGGAHIGWSQILYLLSEPDFVNLFVKEPRNRFPAWRAGTTTTFDVLAHQATLAGIDSGASLTFTTSGSVSVSY